MFWISTHRMLLWPKHFFLAKIYFYQTKDKILFCLFDICCFDRLLWLCFFSFSVYVSVASFGSFFLFLFCLCFCSFFSVFSVFCLCFFCSVFVISVLVWLSVYVSFVLFFLFCFCFYLCFFWFCFFPAFFQLDSGCDLCSLFNSWSMQYFELKTFFSQKIYFCIFIAMNVTHVTPFPNSIMPCPVHK